METLPVSTDRKPSTTVGLDDLPVGEFDESHDTADRVFAPRKRPGLRPPTDLEHPWQAQWLDKSKKAIAYVNTQPERRHVFTEREKFISVGPAFTPQDAEALMRAAVAKWPGGFLCLRGSKEFQHACALAAVRLGHGDLLLDEELVARARAEHEKPLKTEQAETATSPGSAGSDRLTEFLAQRNSTPEADVQPGQDFERSRMR